MYKLSSMLLNQLSGPYSWYTYIVSIYIVGFSLMINNLLYLSDLLLVNDCCLVRLRLNMYNIQCVRLVFTIYLFFI